MNLRREQRIADKAERMTNDELRMTRGMTNDEVRMTNEERKSLKLLRLKKWGLIIANVGLGLLRVFGVKLPGINMDRVQMEIDRLKNNDHLNNNTNMNKEVILGLVRHALTSFGAVFITKGVATGSEVETVASAVAIVVGVIWSIAQKQKSAPQAK